MNRKKKKELWAQEAEIMLAVTDDSNFLSPYCPPGEPVISSEVAEYLENAVKAYHPNQKLKLTITGDCIDESEEKVYKTAIRNYYMLKETEILRDVARKAMVSLWFALIGIVSLAAMVVLSNAGLKSIWAECIDIFAWVFIWEAVDQFFIERNGLLLKCRRSHNFVLMNTSFCRPQTQPVTQEGIE